ncbi:TerB family tellurite resistance protein [Algoriphagus sp. C2-6-M1]|uniref:TerB family tellurite resistance protein n=1 Tax=Algoriphagus persicinus TaxID=3108754 RepID=UPI002B39FEF0|nr:TerB family tellurite resistance protein [Algoriphagus sp. C2-6-M1]MEB2782188.1 TerB family tellurite resistance protein [Algoriphagus sp. C2-6-M1]
MSESDHWKCTGKGKKSNNNSLTVSMMSGKIKQLIWLGMILLALLQPCPGQSQTHEATQLILNYEKLMQMKEILDHMYNGYVVLEKGYSRVKGIAEGNFKLHEAFLNELLKVSPEVRKYYRIAEIIHYQQRILSEYKSTYNKVKDGDSFSAAELSFLVEMYEGLFKVSLRNLDELVLILTAGELRMSDFERLEAIDRLHGEMSGLLISLREINSEINSLGNQRNRMRNERKSILELNGINK